MINKVNRKLHYILPTCGCMFPWWYCRKRCYGGWNILGKMTNKIKIEQFLIRSYWSGPTRLWVSLYKSSIICSKKEGCSIFVFLFLLFEITLKYTLISKQLIRKFRSFSDELFRIVLLVLHQQKNISEKWLP